MLDSRNGMYMHSNNSLLINFSPLRVRTLLIFTLNQRLNISEERIIALHKKFAISDLGS